jgi:hypothetical protein
MVAQVSNQQKVTAWLALVEALPHKVRVCRRISTDARATGAKFRLMFFVCRKGRW